jgi:Uma2 family endonuclease
MKALPSLEHGELTVADYLKTGEGPPWFELIEGRLVLDPSTTSDHQSVARELVLALGIYLKKNPIGTLFFAPLDVYLDARNVFQPDIAVILNSRRDIITQRGLRGAPDIAIEILSPSNHRLDRGPKRIVYAQAGVRELWIVDPESRTIESFHLGQDQATPAHIWHLGDTVTTPLLSGFSITAQEVFGPPRSSGSPLELS